MYESFFGFNRRPFPVAPDTELYFPAASIEHAREKLARLIQRAEGPGLIVGPVGSGKTLLCQALAEQFQAKLQVAHLASAQLCTRRALLQALLYTLGLPYRSRAEGELRLSLIDHLSHQEILGDAVLLIIDEAQTLPLRLLEELRMITNLGRKGQSRVRLVLAGSHLLEEHLASPKLESFSQRIAARCYLTSFEPAETRQYVQAQIAAARGEQQPLFDEAALTAIHRATEGVPRLINQLCDHALVLACAGGAKGPIDEAGVAEAWADLQQLPLPHTMNLAAERERLAHEWVEFGSLEELDAGGDGFLEIATEDEASPAAASHWSAEDDRPEAIPFPGRVGQRFEPEHQVERIAQQLASLEDDFAPIGSIGPEIELVFQDPLNPFGEGFAEEEIVFDRYASLDENYLRGRPRVSSRPLEQVAPARLPAEPTRRADRPADTTSSPRGPSVAAAAFDPVWPEAERETAPAAHARATVEPARQEASDDRDLIIVEDEPLSQPRVRRQEYRQLFAKLRRSS